MAANSPGPTPPREGGLQAMLARLRGMVQPKQEAEPPAVSAAGTEGEPQAFAPEAPPPQPGEPPSTPNHELATIWDAPSPPMAEAPHAAEPPLALPLEAPEAIPLAEPISDEAEEQPVETATPLDLPIALPVEEAELVTEPLAEEPSPAEIVVEEAPVVPAAPRHCPLCQAVRNSGDTYCGDCGIIYPADDEPVSVATPVANTMAATRIKNRYELTERLSERGRLTRFRGLDHGNGPPVPVIIVRGPGVEVPEAIPTAEAVREDSDNETDEVLPTFDAVPTAPVNLIPSTVEITMEQPHWPGVGWERDILDRVAHPALPRVLDTFEDHGYEYVIEELPTGQALWDAWDDPQVSADQRFGWLRQIAECFQGLHRAGAILEGLRPDIICITDAGQARLADVGDLLPLPVPQDAPIRATLYTAPELVAASGMADARADLYSFGATLYALHVGRELAEMDFDRQGSPKPFIPRFPDVHPTFGRLVSKTFSRDLAMRFPSDEASRDDPTGFSELIRTLDVCRRTMDNVRLEIAAWTTTGMIRTGNEDGFALLHAVEARQDDLGEAALILLCDGMGGYEGGEVAAALAIQALRKNLLQQKPLAMLAGQSPFSANQFGPESTIQAPLDVADCKRLLGNALRDANKQVYTASRTGVGRRGMGCTAEAVFVTSRYVVVGHVGDSRVYHLHEGKLIQLTRDQTLVNRLMELGRLTAEEAENHPQKNELQQAVGGHPDVEPGLYHGIMKPGDWIVVCSDGVSNHVSVPMLKEMLQSEATSAEMAARRLVNLVNIEGATDNATVVVVRAT